MVGGAAGVVVLVVCAAAGSIRPATTVVRIRPLCCSFIVFSLSSLGATALPVFRVTSLNTGSRGMLRRIGRNYRRKLLLMVIEVGTLLTIAPENQESGESES